MLSRWGRVIALPVSKEYVLDQIAKLGSVYTFGTKKEIRYLHEIMREGEQILFLTSGFYDGTTWLIVATDLRVIFLDKGLIFGLKQLEFAYEKISSIKQTNGLILAAVTMATSGGEAMIDNIPKGEARKMCEVVSERISRGSRAVPRSSNDDIIDKLKQLAELRDRGVLTEEEFLAQKARILG